ncbi:hypothetical protein PENFLA_c005G10234 [Penicillium flavigenum]|uniref:Uncharacterized protein n=1 Tax=Penicillium flavigenum TaxID=254877 RepID=A0A1V6TNV4_9EURO|nr:hypothetical protein PENFLA_c005G10234 [Penicillium flavigenum]
MAGSTLSFDTPESLSPFLCRTDSDPQPVVIMTCGMAENKYNDYQNEAEKALRNEWKNLIEKSGGRWVTARNKLVVKDSDSAFFVTNEIFESFIAGLGEVVLRLRNEFNTGTDL